MFCREHAVQLHRDRDRFEAEGIELTLIGQRGPKEAAEFRDRFGLEVRLLADADRRSYKLAGTKVATLPELLGPGVVARGIRRGIGNGVVQGRTVGHSAQLGGVLMVATDGTVVWSHLSDDASDNASTDEILEAARAARSPGSA